jgi:hypothetical protein
LVVYFLQIKTVEFPPQNRERKRSREVTGIFVFWVLKQQRDRCLVAKSNCFLGHDLSREIGNYLRCFLANRGKPGTNFEVKVKIVNNEKKSLD